MTAEYSYYRDHYKDKPGGLVVDYLGIAADLKEALSFYSDAGGKGNPTLAKEQAVELMLEKLEVVVFLWTHLGFFGKGLVARLILIENVEIARICHLRVQQ